MSNIAPASPHSGYKASIFLIRCRPRVNCFAYTYSEKIQTPQLSCLDPSQNHPNHLCHAISYEKRGRQSRPSMVFSSDFHRYHVLTCQDLHFHRMKSIFTTTQSDSHRVRELFGSMLWRSLVPVLSSHNKRKAQISLVRLAEQILDGT
jgi:hypothetical protein